MTRCDGWRQRPPTSTRTGRATGNDAAHRDQACGGPRRAVEARSRQGRTGTGQAPEAPTCARRATSTGCIRSRPPAPTCQMTLTPGWLCWESIMPTARSPATRRRQRRKRSSKREGARHACTGTRSSSSQRTRPACKTSTRPARKYRRGNPSWREGQARPVPASGQAGGATTVDPLTVL